MENDDRARARAKYLADGEAAFREYERTSLYYDFADVEKYILELAAGRLATKPPLRKA